MSVVNPHGIAGATVPALRIDVRSFLLGGGAMLFVAWLGLLRPAASHVAGLERQVSHLARSVAELNDTAAGARGTNALLAQLQIQGRQLGDAEAAFARYERVVERVVAQAAALEQATATLDRIDTLHATLADRAPAVGGAATILDDMADLAAKVEASRDTAREARASLAVLDALHQDLTSGMAKIDAVTPVLDDVQALIGRVADSAPSVARAAGVHDRTEDLCRAVIASDSTASGAEQATARLVRIASDLAAAAPTAAPAEDRLARFIALERGLVSGAAGLDDAAAALTRLHDLRDGLRDASATVSGIQHMIVDVMLLEPAVGRAVAALKPVIELTRTARQADPAAMAPRPVAERAPEADPQRAGEPASRPIPVTPVVGAATSVDAVK